MSDVAENRSYSRACFLPLAAIVGIAGLLWIAYRIFFLTGAANSNGTLEESSARFAWGIAVVIQTAMFSSVIGYFWWVLSREAAERRGLFGTIVACLLMVGTAYGAQTLYRPAVSSDEMVLPTKLLRLGLDELKSHTVEVTIDVENALAIVLILSGAIAAGAVLGLGEEVTVQIVRLRWLLNAATLALTVGVVQVFFEYRWAVAIVYPESGQGVTSVPLGGSGIEVASSVTLAAGSVFSLILAGCFVPAASTLKWRVDRHNLSAPRSARIEFGWEVLWKDALKAIAPVLMAGPLAALFKG